MTMAVDWYWEVNGELRQLQGLSSFSWTTGVSKLELVFQFSHQQVANLLYSPAYVLEGASLIGLANHQFIRYCS